MRILIVKNSDLSIASYYDADAPMSYGGPWGDSTQFTHVVVPNEMDPDCVVVVDNEGILEAQEDQALLDAKEERQWEALRKERDKRLAESDWTQIMDSPLSTEARDAWIIYRQELRDIPENTEDPANPDWPERPE
jgi:hypothetical protein